MTHYSFKSYQILTKVATDEQHEIMVGKSYGQCESYLLKQGYTYSWGNADSVNNAIFHRGDEMAAIEGYENR